MTNENSWRRRWPSKSPDRTADTVGMNAAGPDSYDHTQPWWAVKGGRGEGRRQVNRCCVCRCADAHSDTAPFSLGQSQFPPSPSPPEPPLTHCPHSLPPSSRLTGSNHSHLLAVCGEARGLCTCCGWLLYRVPDPPHMRSFASLTSLIAPLKRHLPV